MQDNVMNRDLDILLLKRQAPKVPEGLSERIIAAAIRADEERRTAGVKAGWRVFWAGLLAELDDMIAIPRPAYVMAMMLVIGLSMGTYSDYIDNSFLPSLTTDDISTFMTIEDRFVANEFLGGGSL
jgi:hypothetical protein